MLAFYRYTGLCLALLVFGAAAHAESFELITAEEALKEAQAEAARPTEIRTRQAPLLAAAAAAASQPTAPEVPVLRVAVTRTDSAANNSPVRIEVGFKPAVQGARIVPSSFRVLYGLLRIDLTDRLRKHTDIRENGVTIDQAKLPAGQHRFILQVADDKGNVAEQELRVRVGPTS
jgi:hypothetical protein